ncbi:MULTISPECIES: DUF983 domain-containing protein [Roseivirga]|uniref:DUF983 domain-containing protein n=1 Tax=Roseivirga thermotolerans TaxID=1758176 RepID=A0ABQ3I598_9BACT|nr:MULTISPECIES: DUF983 domain-containing protein [Roseivirga]MEC7753596.1 DUF983 domain-containing protein [Bacteroidota bacterium]GHE65669.1 hypothetical protein GCM10011340_21020 [Roseivirga thermotolerans]
MLKTVKSIFRQKCPNCEEGSVFHSNGNILRMKSPGMNENCPVCGHKFEKEPGYFIGAMYMSYGLSLAELGGLFLLWQLTGLPLSGFIYAAIVLLVALMFLNFRLARIIWMYLFR